MARISKTKNTGLQQSHDFFVANLTLEEISKIKIPQASLLWVPSTLKDPLKNSG